MDNIVHVRIDDKQAAWLDEIVKQTGMTRSQVLRHLLDAATIKPAVIRTDPIAASEEPVTA